MVDVKDLMQGNYIIFHDDSNDIVRVEYFFKEDDMWFVEWTMVKGTSDFKSGNSWVGEFKYIPLTASILENNLGFEKCLRDGYGDYQIVCGKGTTANGLFIIIDINSWGIVIGQLIHFSHEFGEYRFVHQLQNIYKMITQTDLPIKF